MSMREKAAITGIGETVYSRESGRSVVSLQLEASLRAIEDAGLRPSDIDGVIPYGSAVVAEELVTNFGSAISASPPPRRSAAQAVWPRSNAPLPLSRPGSAIMC
jgi:acetyl-CoA acetyltransferase